MSAIADEYAVERDHRAAERDRRADERDRRADARDGVIDLRDRPSTNAMRRSNARDRRAAASDRAEAVLDREAAANERDDAVEERQILLHDQLTGVLQRSAGLIALEAVASRTQRTDGSFVVAFIDVDGLKRVNDQHGHAAGDTVLRTVGETLRSEMRRRDLALRYGGDEFVCVLPDVELSAIEARFEHISKALAAAPHPVSVSVGLAASRPGESTDAVMARADAALYAGRAARRDAAG